MPPSWTPFIPCCNYILWLSAQLDENLQIGYRYNAVKLNSSIYYYFQKEIECSLWRGLVQDKLVSMIIGNQ
jgi:hypothetical protein